MKLTLAAVLLTAGCNLINSNTFSVSYSFDPQEYKKDVGSAQGMFPQVACDSDAACSAATVPAGSPLMVSCDTHTSGCIASAQLSLSYPIDLSSQHGFPSDAVKYGINFVSIQRVEYWVSANSITVATPPIDLYVAPGSATDASQGTRLGSVGALGAKSTTCTDPIDTNNDTAAGGAMVCDLPLDSAGTTALANFAKDYKNEFQIIAVATVSAQGGDPLPAGTIDFFVRPIVSIGILK